MNWASFGYGVLTASAWFVLGAAALAAVIHGADRRRP